MNQIVYVSKNREVQEVQQEVQIVFKEFNNDFPVKKGLGVFQT